VRREKGNVLDKQTSNHLGTGTKREKMSQDTKIKAGEIKLK